LSAGASLTPSPVTATTSPGLEARTMRSLSSGETRANTETSSTRCSQLVVVEGGELGAGEHRRVAVADAEVGGDGRAVTAWSPVIITTRMPASRQVAIASRTPARGGSIIPWSPRKTSIAGGSSRAPGRDGGSGAAVRPWRGPAARGPPARAAAVTVAVDRAPSRRR
jgi:hypothetical protein